MFDPAKFPIEEFVSTPRLRRYLSGGKSDTEAFRLYFWNHELAKAFLGPLAILEVTLRNAMHEALSSKYGPDWILNDAILPLLDDDRANFDKTIGRLTPILNRNNQILTPDAVVGSSSLGDWVRLLDVGDPRSSNHNYEKTLWEPALVNAFPHMRSGWKRRQVHHEFNRIRSFRNRVVHHEPIFHRNLRSIMEDIINAASLIHKDAGEVIKQGHCLETPLQGRHDAIDEGDCCL
ncbi:Abi family protein [Corynebacterium dentalis]|uniref:Abi family protein n=1 Tax=Corynebacterium dentalis TaxID=2014528 RepID=UPI000C08BB46|nr:Abi family protein [Corynebacterium dentalis]